MDERHAFMACWWLVVSARAVADVFLPVGQEFGNCTLVQYALVDGGRVCRASASRVRDWSIHLRVPSDGITGLLAVVLAGWRCRDGGEGEAVGRSNRNRMLSLLKALHVDEFEGAHLVERGGVGFPKLFGSAGDRHDSDVEIVATPE